MKNLLNNLFNKLVKKVVNNRTSFAFGIIVTLVVVYGAIPEVQAGYAQLQERLNPPVEYQRPEAEAPTINPEKLEQYYQEELKALESKYVKAHQNAARASAIERVEADLEVEKEQLRQEELFL